ncbi:hypothetical protein RIF29_38106 [Crotalaria pallida]|uniref:Uncharacterized protein n=1 Tax=Crotalaria pallida TaxID=3830 RepID=A0AAN9DYN4_CROPI
MEESKAPELAAAAAAAAAAAPQTLPPRPPSSTTPIPPTTKKRPLDSHSLFHNSNYIKIRALVRDLRPHFLQVIQSADYQNCKASHEIQEQLKILMNLYDNLKADIGKSRNMLNGQNVDHKTTQEQLQAERAFARSSEIKLTSPVSGLQKLPTEDCQTHGTYVVGGSAFGWNFITFSGNEPVYYGRTKEQFREVNQLSNSSAPCLNSPQPLD